MLETQEVDWLNEIFNMDGTVEVDKDRRTYMF
jgi:hypothetical protein